MKKILSVILALIFILSLLSLSAFASITEETKTLNTSNTSKAYRAKVGDTFEFGSYSQSLITDSDLVDALENIEGSWISYDYYYSDTSQSDFMKYRDVKYKGEKYRAVTFSSYRPISTSSPNYSSQDNNGYHTNTVYWFKYEPLEWKVLNPDTGLCMCTSIIDSQQFYNNYGEFCYANSYKHS